MAIICRRKMISNRQFRPHVLGEGTPEFVMSIFIYGLLPNTLQSLVNFFGDLCVDEQNAKFQRVAQNALWNLRRLRDRIYLVCKACAGSFVVKKFFSIVISSTHVFRGFSRLSLDVVTKPRKNRQFWSPRFRGEARTLKFWTPMFKSDSFPTMW